MQKCVSYCSRQREPSKINNWKHGMMPKGSGKEWACPLPDNLLQGSFSFYQVSPLNVILPPYSLSCPPWDLENLALKHGRPRATTVWKIKGQRRNTFIILH
jgi:hypothetical protein